MAARPPTPGGGSGTESRKWPVKFTESYGGVVVREHNGHEVALIRVRNLKGKDVWALPKGGREAGEDGARAALREVREETGLDAEIVEPLDSITYWFLWPPEQVRYKKTVHLYLMRTLGGDISAHDNEVEEVRFFPLDEAVRKATYRTDKQVLERVAKMARAW
jgi:8-oxo-dGTP pyrophosphatase MutT (NUDIX family)